MSRFKMSDEEPQRFSQYQTILMKKFLLSNRILYRMIPHVFYYHFLLEALLHCVYLGDFLWFYCVELQCLLLFVWIKDQNDTNKVLEMQIKILKCRNSVLNCYKIVPYSLSKFFFISAPIQGQEWIEIRVFL